MNHFVQTYNRNSKPFAWTASTDSIFQKFASLCSRIAGTQDYGIFGNRVALFQRSVSTLPVGRVDLTVLAQAYINSDNASGPALRLERAWMAPLVAGSWLSP